MFPCVIYCPGQYPWGVVDIENPDHSDFTFLKRFLIQTHMQVDKLNVEICQIFSWKSLRSLTLWPLLTVSHPGPERRDPRRALRKLPDHLSQRTEGPGGLLGRDTRIGNISGRFKTWLLSTSRQQELENWLLFTVLERNTTLVAEWQKPGRARSIYNILQIWTFSTDSVLQGLFYIQLCHWLIN